MADSKDKVILPRRDVVIGATAALSTAVIGASTLPFLTEAAAAEPAHAKELASAEEWAAMEFEPWRHCEGEWTPPSNEAMKHDLVHSRIAWQILYKTKAELMASFIEMEAAKEAEGTDYFMQLIERLNGVEGNFRILADMIQSASARLLIAATAVVQQQEAS